MLSDFPYINLPNDLLFLLKGQFHNGRDSLTKLSIIAEKNLSLCQLIKKTMNEFDPEMRVEGVIKTLGFEAFRSRLSSVYLHRYEFDHYPSESSLDRVQGITDLSNAFQELTVMNSSRVFLLGIYLEFARVRKKQEGEMSNLDIPTETISFLLQRKSKNPNIDWLILLTWHFIEYFGLVEFKNILKKYNSEYENIYLSMDENSRCKVMANLLSYGASVQDLDAFLYERV